MKLNRYVTNTDYKTTKTNKPTTHPENRANKTNHHTLITHNIEHHQPLIQSVGINTSHRTAHPENRTSKTNHQPLIQSPSSSSGQARRRIRAEIKLGNKKMNLYYVYILKCNNGSYYTGHTDDIEKRMAEHNSGYGGNYTSTRLPVELMFVESFSTRDEAFIAERKIKGWSRKKKESLIKNGWQSFSAS